tara:strand:- start:11797 stop:12009 length:213 start_codon:yes stop_codon:yes gene_type:complete
MSTEFAEEAILFLLLAIGWLLWASAICFVWYTIIRAMHFIGQMFKSLREDFVCRMHESGDVVEVSDIEEP